MSTLAPDKTWTPRTATPTETVATCHLRRAQYTPTWELQERLQKHLIQAKRQEERSAPPHMLLLVEHPPVYTLGKSGEAEHLLLSEDALRQRGASFHRIDRGGDITYHGPGQLVGYPILDLDRFFTDLGRYLRALEETVIRTCGDYDVNGRRVEGRTGVWIGPDDQGLERKICAMGIRCSRWVTMHGFAFNLNTDLDFFSHIVPCGIDDRGVTSLAAETGRHVDEEAAAGRLLQHFADVFEVEIQYFDREKALPFLEDYL